MDMAWHNTNFAVFARNDNTWAVRANKAYTTFLLEISFYKKHIHSRNAFRNTNNKLNTSLCSFNDGIFTESSWYINHRSCSASRFYRFFYSVKYWQAKVSLPTLTWGNPTHHLSTVSNRLFRMQRTLRTSKTLANNLSVFIDQDTHAAPPTASTICFAASLKPDAAIIFSPLSARILLPSSALLPSKRTTTGTSTPTSFTAPKIPSAIKSQRTIPPKIFTKTPFTLSSERIILNASVTRSLVAPPPTSKKLAGEPPVS